MKRGFLYTAIFVSCFSVSLILHIPASFALKQLPPVRGLAIEGIDGSLWQGRATAVSWNNVNYGAVQWDFQFTKLLQAKTELAVRFGRQSDMDLRGKGLVGYSLKGAYIENLVAAIPAEKVLDYVPTIPVPLTVAGQLELSVRHAVYAQPWCQTAEGTLAWSNSGVESPLGALNLGPVIADIVCEDNNITVKGGQHSLEVNSEFSAQLGSDKGYSASAWFKPEAEFPPAMGNQLKWLGSPNDQGQYLFNYQGNL